MKPRCETCDTVLKLVTEVIQKKGDEPHSGWVKRLTGWCDGCQAQVYGDLKEPNETKMENASSCSYRWGYINAKFPTENPYRTR